MLSSSGVSEQPISVLDSEVVRARSKVLFGNMDRIAVAVAIAESPDGLVNATDLTWQLRLANNRVRAQLVAFAEVGLLQALPGDGDKKRWYSRLESPFWRACQDLVRDWRS
jgi:hypothetical protein